jgi:hypothetical protein
MAKAATYRAKPMHIQTMRWTGDNTDRVIDWLLSYGRPATWHDAIDLHTEPDGRCPRRSEHIIVETEHGTVYAMVGDWIVITERGERIVFGPDAFAAVYEPA